MDSIKMLWGKFKTQPDIWFFFGFLLTFTLSVRKVLFYFPILGTFNEYSGMYLYISDIFLLLTLLSWLISILCNNSITLSRYLPPTKNLLSHYKTYLKQFLVGGELWISNIFHRLYILLPSFLVLLSFISIFWSQNQSIALFRSIKLLEFYLLYLYIIFRIVPQLFHACPPEKCSTLAPLILDVPRGTSKIITGWNKLLFGTIIFLGLFQAIIGIIQFFLQKSIGLFWLKESLISPDILGVAKVILNSEKFIRAYGLMPHPNILGGFLLFSIIITLLYQKCSMRNIKNGIWLFRLILTIQIFSLILTFSKSAIIGLLIALVYIYVSRGTFIKNLKQLQNFKLIILSVLIILFSSFILIKPDLNSLFTKSLNERLFYLNVPHGTFVEHPILGIGTGQSVLMMQKFYSQTLNFWEYQPVHNVFLLILSELDVFGLGVFIWWLWELFHAKQLKEKNNEYILQNNNTTLSSIVISRYFKGILLGLIFIMLFDHYLWDIQQGSFLFWLTAGFVAGITKNWYCGNEIVIS
ncbi:MAG TPA: O-antigen ligase family protein [Candidatus Moranbacteria bacterium]|nr:O-antigen ligase family protein [Candidatus Moranbacteria bacterium]